MASDGMSGYPLLTAPTAPTVKDMPETSDIWRKALDLGARMGLISATRASAVSTLPAGTSPIDVTTFATSLGVSRETLDALVGLARSLPADAQAALPTAPIITQGSGRAAADLLEESVQPVEVDTAPCRTELELSNLADPARTWRFAGPMTVRIGRSLRNHVHLDDPRVSGYHAEIDVSGAGCQVRDTKSSHGIRVNEVRVEERGLVDGDLVQVGSTQLRVTIHDASNAPPSEPASCEKCGGRSTVEQVRADIAGWNGQTFQCASCRTADLTVWPEVTGYAIERELKKGGQGRVFLAREMAPPGRTIVLKTVRLPWGIPDEEVTRRVQFFQREAALSLMFRHTNAVETYKFAVEGRTMYIAMEYVSGGGLQDYVARRGLLGWREASTFLMQALDAISAAHAAKIVHRDLKPENLLLTEASPSGRVKVADLGLAKNFALAGLSGHTVTGMWGGTMAYIAPEQLTDFKYAGPGVDVFSLGAIFFRIVTGAEMYEGGASSLVERVLECPIRSLASVKPDVPAPVASVIDRALARDVNVRYADAGQMRVALARALEEA